MHQRNKMNPEDVQEQCPRASSDCLPASQQSHSDGNYFLPEHRILVGDELGEGFNISRFPFRIFIDLLT